MPIEVDLYLAILAAFPRQSTHRRVIVDKVGILIHNPVHKMCGLTRLRWS